MSMRIPCDTCKRPKKNLKLLYQQKLTLWIKMAKRLGKMKVPPNSTSKK